MKRILFFSLILFAIACSNEVPAEEPQTEESQEVSGQEIIDSLRSRALPEDDIAGRLQASIQPVIEAFAASEPNMPSLANVEVTLDENCLFRIINRAEGEVETRVDLRQLDPNGFSLIRDDQPGEFPGLRIATLDQEPLVEIYRNGELMTRNNELVIKLMDRKSIETITPVMLQTIHLCRGDY